MTGNFNRQLDAALLVAPSYVTILGGTNDLGRGYALDEVISNICGLARRVAANGATPVLMSIPSLTKARSSSLTPKEDADARTVRQDMRHRLEAFCAELRFPFVDLLSATSDPVSGYLRDELSEDGLHLNREGYSIMGNMVHAAIMGHYKKKCVQ